MMLINRRSCRLTAFFLLSLQSLSDIAREEADRRRRLDQQGIEAKIIEGVPEDLAPNGSLTTSTPDLAAAGQARASSTAGKSPPSARSYRTALQKLDRTIRKDQKRLKTLRSRLQAEKWAPPRVGPITRSGSAAEPQSRLQADIDELESRLKQLREERSELYAEGRKAGFLPGELDGKGIMP